MGQALKSNKGLHHAASIKINRGQGLLFKPFFPKLTGNVSFCKSLEKNKDYTFNNVRLPSDNVDVF